jgi:uncharacterized protein (DUF2252 family)
MGRPALGNERITVLMQPKVAKGLRVLAKRRHETFSDLVRAACQQYLVAEITKEKERAGTP